MALLVPRHEINTVDWLETRELGTWARESLSTMPCPPLHSPARNVVLDSIEQLEVSKRQIKRQIDDLLLKLQFVELSIEQKKATIAPIRFIPPEVLRNIFNPDGANTFPRDRKRTQALTAVCSNWRQIALHQRDLWNRIDVYHGYTERCLCGTSQQRNPMYHWVNNTTNVTPLYLTLRLQGDCCTRKALRTLQHRAPQWRELDVAISAGRGLSAEIMSDFFEFLTNATTLTSLKLNTHHMSSSTAVQLPMLQKLHLVDCPFPNISSDELQELTLEFTIYHGVLFANFLGDINHRFPNLSALNLLEIYMPNHITNGTVPHNLRFANLRNLKVQHSSRPRIELTQAIMVIDRSPNLRQLDIPPKFLRYYMDHAQPLRLGVIEHLSLHDRQLFLHWRPMHKRIAPLGLMKLVNLKVLEIQLQSLVPEFIQHSSALLKTLRLRSEICPALEVLKIRVSMASNSECSVLYQAIQLTVARHARGMRLEVYDNQNRLHSLVGRRELTLRSLGLVMALRPSDEFLARIEAEGEALDVTHTADEDDGGPEEEEPGPLTDMHAPAAHVQHQFGLWPFVDEYEDTGDEDDMEFDELGPHGLGPHEMEPYVWFDAALDGEEDLDEYFDEELEDGIF